jgi:hypothetical protein
VNAINKKPLEEPTDVSTASTERERERSTTGVVTVELCEWLIGRGASRILFTPSPRSSLLSSLLVPLMSFVTAVARESASLLYSMTHSVVSKTLATASHIVVTSTQDAHQVVQHIRLGVSASLFSYSRCRDLMRSHSAIDGVVRELLFLNGFFLLVIPVLFLQFLQPLLLSLFNADVYCRTTPIDTDDNPLTLTMVLRGWH